MCLVRPNRIHYKMELELYPLAFSLCHSLITPTPLFRPPEKRHCLQIVYKNKILKQINYYIYH